MSDNSVPAPPIVRLRFRKGELIQKAHNYCPAVYKILSGQVDIVSEIMGIEVVEETLGPGDLVEAGLPAIRGRAPSPLGARAVDDAEVEAWPLARLLDEFEALSPAVRYMLDQPVARLNRTEKLIAQLKAKANEPPKDENASEPESEAQRQAWSTQQRKHYRKKVDKRCRYTPVSEKAGLRLFGDMKDISMGGTGVEINVSNVAICRHDPGDAFEIEAQLPNNRQVTFVAEIVHVKPVRKEGKLFLGMTIKSIGYEANKQLGFFLMP